VPEPLAAAAVSSLVSYVSPESGPRLGGGAAGDEGPAWLLRNLDLDEATETAATGGQGAEEVDDSLFDYEIERLPSDGSVIEWAELI